jgi:hypothetical protein
MYLEYESILKTVPVLSVFVAICALIYQIRRSRFSLNVELTLKLEDRFNSSDFEKIRSNAAKSMLKKQFHLAEDVFDFFETLGYLVRRKAVDKEIVWHTFFHWVHGYWSAGAQQITKRRNEEKDQTLWEDFEYLHRLLVELDRRKNRKRCTALLGRSQIDQFLKQER